MEQVTQEIMGTVESRLCLHTSVVALVVFLSLSSYDSVYYDGALGVQQLTFLAVMTEFLEYDVCDESHWSSNR